MWILSVCFAEVSLSLEFLSGQSSSPSPGKASPVRPEALACVCGPWVLGLWHLLASPHCLAVGFYTCVGRSGLRTQDGCLTELSPTASPPAKPAVTLTSCHPRAVLSPALPSPCCNWSCVLGAHTPHHRTPYLRLSSCVMYLLDFHI